MAGSDLRACAAGQQRFAVHTPNNTTQQFEFTHGDSQLCTPEGVVSQVVVAGAAARRHRRRQLLPRLAAQLGSSICLHQQQQGADALSDAQGWQLCIKPTTKEPPPATGSSTA
jgi:hypothetical protein